MAESNGKRPLFILAGNGPYENRGCEAILRGTIEILRNYFDDPQFLVVSNFKSKAQFNDQRGGEIDNNIIHEKTIRYKKRFGPMHFLNYGLKVLFPTLKPYLSYMRMLPYLRRSIAVLSVGGDNYSLDYGKPDLWTDLDDLALAKKKAIIIWGASVGPFSQIPEYETLIIGHLKKVNAVFARESSTIEYLGSRGVTENVYRVADPAFLLKPTVPANNTFDGKIPKGAIGINMSPLMARYTSNGDIRKWTELAANIVKTISDQLKRPLYLIPHVTVPDSNDYEFLKKVNAHAGRCQGKIELIRPNLNAAETKWVISQMAVFAGARTHTTIAAISSGVPTLSFAYSLKAKGINNDVYGHDNYCLNPHQLEPKTITERLEELIYESDEIKKQINAELPRINKLAMDAGKYLKDILENLNNQTFQ